MLRRKQCCVMMVIEIILMICFVGLGIGMYFWWVSFVAENARIDADDQIIDTYANEITFAHCNYVEHPDDTHGGNPFNTVSLFLTGFFEAKIGFLKVG